MPISINDPQAEALVRELTAKTGESAEQAVLQSLRERLQRLSVDELEENGKQYPTYEGEELIRHLTNIALHCAALPDLDSRSADEIIGYDENGLPT